ncbi:MAG: 30S ribosomal protein S6 [Armatimonadota bacterium]|nr:30S ribosomal protein S6 [Armatimonadota bacterium]MDH7481167.1 30S ribosomal protein S6 [Armatimonadota bacterium]
MVRSYEALYIIPPGLQEEEITPITEKYKQVVESQGGEVEGVTRWETRKLAYEIKGQREGIYVLMTFKSEPKVAAELDRVFRIGEDVLRHIIVRRDEK